MIYRSNRSLASSPRLSTRSPVERGVAQDITIAA